MGRGEWKKKGIYVKSWREGKEGRLSGKEEKRMGRMLTVGSLGEKEQENN